MFPNRLHGSAWIKRALKWPGTITSSPMMARGWPREGPNSFKVWQRIDSAAKVLKEAGNLDYMELSIAAKAYFVLIRLNGKATLEDIAGMLPRFGWSVTNEDLAKATAFLRSEERRVGKECRSRWS